MYWNREEALSKCPRWKRAPGKWTLSASASSSSSLEFDHLGARTRVDDDPPLILAATCVIQTIVWYLLFLIGTIRLAIRRFKRRVEDADMAQEYEIAEVVACSDNNWAFVTLSFCNMLEKGGGSICTPGNELATLMNLDTVTNAKGTPISLAVTYDHHGRKHIVTYSLADLTPVRFPPIKPLAETVEETPSTKLAVLSASFGSWFSSEDNADVTDLITHLLGPEKDFYAAANISQYIWCIVQYLRTQGVRVEEAPQASDLESDVDAPIKPPIVYKGRALLNLLSTGDKKWPLSTDVACWWCCHKFACTPCPLPVAYKEGKGFLVKGCFCSFSCAKAYNFREGGAARDLHNHYLFLLTQRLWYSSHKGVPFPGVVAAPSRACLKMFGGYMDIDEFRKASNTHIHMVREPPYPVEVIQQVDCVTAISDKRYAITQGDASKNSTVTDEKASKKASELESRKRTRLEGALSLKREKPMVSKGCSLDKFVNVKAPGKKK
eukprot:jgi/Mesvir1/1906/Mv22936-RA.1